MRRVGFDETHEMFRSSVAEFVRREVLPEFANWEAAGLVDRGLFLKAGAAGLLGLGMPADVGGSGTTDFRYNAIVIEEFAAAGVLNAAQGLMLQSNVLLPYLERYGTPSQRARWMPGLCNGELIGGIAMTEPGTGSDLSAIATVARPDGDDWVVTGSKQFISNGTNGDAFLVVCRTGDGGDRHNNLSLLLVDAQLPGFSRGRNLAKVGQHCADTSELFFDDVRVPADYLLGDEGSGFRHLVAGLPQERLTIALQAVAHAEAAFGWTLDYCRERTAFGQPIGTFQNSRFTLATLRTELDIAWVFLDRQLDALATGELTAEDAAEAKWWCAELNKRVLDAGVQLHGGYGYMEEYPIARAWRDGRPMSIYGGTTEILKELIGRRVLGL